MNLLIIDLVLSILYLNVILKTDTRMKCQCCSCDCKHIPSMSFRGIFSRLHLALLNNTVFTLKAAYSVTMNIFRKKKNLFKSFVKVELSYVFTIKMFSTAKNCM